MEITSGFARLPISPADPQPAPTSAAADDGAADAAVEALSRMVQSSDEMSAALTQFRNRRNFEVQVETPPGEFARVLEDDTLPKAQQVLALARVGKRPVEWLLAQLRNLFPDDSDLVLVLRELLRSKNLDAAERSRLQDAHDEVMRQAPQRALKAGINSALKARLFGNALRLDPRRLRSSYRSFLENSGGPLDDYEDWIALYGPGNRQSILDFIESALLTDIAAQDPSCSHAHFGGLLARLGHLKLLRSCEQLFVMQLARCQVLMQADLEEAALLVLMLGVLRHPDQLDDLLQADVGRALLLARHSERAEVLQRLHAALASLPAELFCDSDGFLSLEANLRKLAHISYIQELGERRRRNP